MIGDYHHQRYYPSGWVRNPIVSNNPGNLKATDSDLRQADDLLSNVHLDVGGDQRHYVDFNAERLATL